MSADAVLDARVMSAPELPHHRPSTKGEVWARLHFIYHDLKDPEELRAFAREWWAGIFMLYVNTRDWRKQPDWVEGDPVIDEATPQGPFVAGTNYIRETERLWGIAQSVKATLGERKAA